jgi:uncharacterized protein YkwD
VKRIYLLISILLAGCAPDQSANVTPTHVEIVFISPTPSPLVEGSPTDEPLPFRDLSTPTETASPIPPSPTPQPAQLAPPTQPPQPVLPAPTAAPAVVATSPPVIAASPTASPAQPTTIPVQPVSDVASAEQAVIDLTNSYRAQNGLSPLARDEAIMNIARARSADMVARNYFGHTDPITGASLAKPLILALGYGRAGENIYWSGKELAGFSAAAVGWFMGDAPHRANILNVSYTAIGVGIVWNGLGWTLTQNFGGP